MLKLTSQAIQHGRLQQRYGILGPIDNIEFGIPQTSFPLRWSGAPPKTRSYAIEFMDYDNAQDEGFPFIHWLVCDIGAGVTGLPEDASRRYSACHQGHNSWSIPFGEYASIPDEYSLRFGGPAPNREHEYEIWLYALDNVPGLPTGFWYNDLRRVLRDHVLDKTVLRARYGLNQQQFQVIRPRLPSAGDLPHPHDRPAITGTQRPAADYLGSPAVTGR